MTSPALANAVKIDQVRDIRKRIAADVGFFPAHVLGNPLWEKQREIAASVRKNRRTAVISGHATGKTNTIACVILEAMTMHPNARIILTATTWNQVKDTAWGEVKRLYRNAKLPLGGMMLDTRWTIADGSLATCISVDDPTALQGVHGPFVLVIVDEAEGLGQDMWAAIESLMSSEGSRLLVCFNPVTPSGFLYEASKQPREWNFINVSCLDHPNVTSGQNQIPGAVTREWVDEMRAKHGEDSPFWHARVLGKFPDAGSDSLLSAREIEATEGIQTGVKEPRRIGLDVARMGSDTSVLTVYDETRTLIAVESWRSEDLMQTAGRLIDAIRRFKVEPRNACVDVCGIGAGVVDRCREAGMIVTPVDFGGGPVGDWAPLLGREAGFPNRRCELHAVMRQLVREKAISIPTRYREIVADLSAIRYWYDGRGRFVVEPKDAIKERIRRSPDFSDAAILALGAPCNRRVAIY